MKDHTFVICAYKNSPYIKECIESLLSQTYKSQIMLCTSTPSEYLEKMCDEYRIDYCVREGKPSIGEDWNYALSMAKTSYVTIAHQDDVYESEYAETMMNTVRGKEALILFSDYYELVGKNKYANRINLVIKRILLYPLRNRKKQASYKRKRQVLRFGNAISCPTVTYNMDRIQGVLKADKRNRLFQNYFRSNLDWEAWEWLSKKEGAFVYIPRCLMSHRIHAESETSAVIEGNGRRQEDYAMFCKFWPKWIAKLLSGVYGASEKSNEV